MFIKDILSAKRICINSSINSTVFSHTHKSFLFNSLQKERITYKERDLILPIGHTVIYNINYK